MAEPSDQLYVALARRAGYPPEVALRQCREVQVQALRRGQPATLFGVARARGLMNDQQVACFLTWTDMIQRRDPRPLEDTSTLSAGPAAQPAPAPTQAYAAVLAPPPPKVQPPPPPRPSDAPQSGDAFELDLSRSRVIFKSAADFPTVYPVCPSCGLELDDLALMEGRAAEDSGGKRVCRDCSAPKASTPGGSQRKVPGGESARAAQRGQSARAKRGQSARAAPRGESARVAHSGEAEQAAESPGGTEGSVAKPRRGLARALHTSAVVAVQAIQRRRRRRQREAARSSDLPLMLAGAAMLGLATGIAGVLVARPGTAGPGEPPPAPTSTPEVPVEEAPGADPLAAARRQVAQSWRLVGDGREQAALAELRALRAQLEGEPGSAAALEVLDAGLKEIGELGESR